MLSKLALSVIISIMDRVKGMTCQIVPYKDLAKEIYVWQVYV